MARRYAQLWTEIKNKKQVVVKCKPAKVATIIACVRKEKSRENAPRHALEMQSFGRLKAEHKIINGEGIITFKLVNSYRSYEL